MESMKRVWYILLLCVSVSAMEQSSESDEEREKAKFFCIVTDDESPPRRSTDLPISRSRSDSSAPYSLRSSDSSSRSSTGSSFEATRTAVTAQLNTLKAGSGLAKSNSFQVDTGKRDSRFELLKKFWNSITHKRGNSPKLSTLKTHDQAIKKELETFPCFKVESSVNKKIVFSKQEQDALENVSKKPLFQRLTSKTKIPSVPVLSENIINEEFKALIESFDVTGFQQFLCDNPLAFIPLYQVNQLVDTIAKRALDEYPIVLSDETKSLIAIFNLLILKRSDLNFSYAKTIFDQKKLYEMSDIKGLYRAMSLIY